MGEKNNGKPRQPRRSEIQAMGMSAGVVFSAGFSLVFSAFAGLAIGIALDRRGGARFSLSAFFLASSPASTGCTLPSEWLRRERCAEHFRRMNATSRSSME